MSAVNNEYNCLYVHNNSKKIVTVFIYEGFSPVCTFSSVSKILEPEQKCHHYIKERFKFEIFENKEKGTKEKCLGPEECNGIRVIKVSDGEHSLKCEQNTVNHDKKKIVRRVKRENDLPSGDLYAQLGLDMREVREMNEVERKSHSKGFLKMILIWHPDKPNGDKEIADQLVQARNILLEDEMRAQYHNHIDIQQGWLSSRRWKAIFNPEMVTAEQKLSSNDLLFLACLLYWLLVVLQLLFYSWSSSSSFVILGAIAGER
ncbi:uncharacterized protein LOC124448078 [Xenia sp. Carnegie-2017]|uniref:uncharacterized protein LOC124448078 n=1 Tax=Xenia sp. Carnegie-2017 TaxID=2897299 RepID=UPI001F04385F|nr:uncharacterized protein LOC124448078 [Xenia sp. Carnegie-2017]XP_046855053.1 uncharacterized protein LOC124448078 [Xenia sp. Carnegie-2017]XP_046855054.1 uncharacterized protein LOC124448078 [Xenia sp. Carnegie-2017]